MQEGASPKQVKREKTEADEEDRGGERRKVHMNFIWTSYIRTSVSSEMPSEADLLNFATHHQSERPRVGDQSQIMLMANDRRLSIKTLH